MNPKCVVVSSVMTVPGTDQKHPLILMMSPVTGVKEIDAIIDEEIAVAVESLLKLKSEGKDCEVVRIDYLEMFPGLPMFTMSTGAKSFTLTEFIAKRDELRKTLFPQAGGNA